MEAGFMKANSANFPRIDLMMLGEFLASNQDFCSPEFRNVKTSSSSRPSYGDDAISYVQLKRSGQICIVKCKICPEHKVHAKLYEVTLTVDEDEEKIVSVTCHDCVAAQGGCKHAIALLMWVHRRSEEPSCTEVQCYWLKSKLSRVGSTLKFMASKDLANGSTIMPSNAQLFQKYVQQAQNRNIKTCHLLRYQQGYTCNDLYAYTMHQLMVQYGNACADIFVSNIQLSDNIVMNIEAKTRQQYKSKLWGELRYARITASRAYEVSRCQTLDGNLTSVIMGGKLMETSAMKRGRILEDQVRETVALLLGENIRKCGLFISKCHPMVAGSPDGICGNSIVEIKCPESPKTYSNYIKNGLPSNKCYAQIQMQMYLSGLRRCDFCVADCDYTTNKKVEIVSVKFDEKYVLNLLKKIVFFWKINVFPLLHRSTSV